MGNGALAGLNGSFDGMDEPIWDEHGMPSEWKGSDESDFSFEEEKTPKEIFLTGAVGKFACHINNRFVETDRMHNEHVLYKSSSNHWLRYAMDGRWMVSDTKDKDENVLAGFCYCKQVGLPDPSYAKGWFVLGVQGIFRTQTQVQAVRRSETMGSESVMQSAQKNLNEECKSEEMQQQRSQEETEKKKIELPMAIKVQGATGLISHSINGIFKRQQGANVFYRSDQRTTMYYDSSQRWIVHDGERALAYCGVTGLSNPCDTSATRWYVTNSSKSFSVQPKLSVTSLDTKKNEPNSYLPKMKKNARPSFTSDLLSLSSLTTKVARISRTGLAESTCTYNPRIRRRRRRRNSFSSLDAKESKIVTPYMKALARMRKMPCQK